jgi:hypothetical protein
MHAYRPGQGTARSRVLYMFRSPALVQIGRKPLDAEVREALEHTHPDLTFDWIGLLREPMPPPRPDPRERAGRQRPQGRREKPSRDQASQPPPVAMAVVIEDDSTLGRVVGGAEAARLRAKYAELNQRISRRARTPEERDRLLEASARVNPDDWSDEAAIRANLTDVETRWEAITGELPRRRRGRRGGKSRESDQVASGDVIIGEHDNPIQDAQDDDEQDSHTDQSDSSTALAAVASARGDGGDGDDQRPAGPTEAGSDDAPETDVR